MEPSDIDDLVLHEGNGRIRRPSKIVSGAKSNKSNDKLKRMPSPRKVPAAATTSSSKIKYDKCDSSSLSPKSERHDDNSVIEKEKDTTRRRVKNKLGMDEFLNKVRRKSNSGSVPTNSSNTSNDSFDESDDDDGDDENGDTIFFNKNSDVEISRSINNANNKYHYHRKAKHSNEDDSTYELTSEDIEIYQRLDDEYERALEERDIGYNARYASVKQTAMWSVFFFLVYMVQGTICYRELLWLNYNRNHHHKEGEEEEFDTEFNKWSLPESLFFSIFTITTVGYGREDLPTTASFQAYTIVYILIGIAAITIMVAQVFQCIALEASRARLSQDKVTEIRRRSGLMISNENGGNPGNASINKHSQHSDDNDPNDSIIIPHTHTGFASKSIDCFFRFMDRAKNFFRDTEIGKGISVVFPFAGLILSGALVVGPLEQWSFLESLYFAVVSLTTVGFGDYVPTELASIWFCIFWLPFSIGFMSLYLGNVAQFYIRLSDKNIRRIERRLRRRLEKAKEKAEEERAEVLQRAYRGQEADIEMVAATKQLDSSVDTNKSNGYPGIGSSRSACGGGSGGGGDTDGRNLPGIPINHVRSVMRRKAKRRKSGGFDILPTSESDSCSDDGSDHLAGGSTHVIAPAIDAGHQRRQRIIDNCRVISLDSTINCNDDNAANENQRNENSSSRSNDPSVKSMRDVIRAVRNMINPKNNEANSPDTNNNNNSHFMTIQSTENMIDYSMFRRRISKKPSFALRVLVQERFAKIIATEVAGYHTSVEIKEHTLSVTIDTMSDTAEKWCIPRKARKAFRTVALEILYFVGEHGLITRGADALYELTPFEFHGLFSSLVAAMGDADTMEDWLAKTETLALVDLESGVLKRSAPGGSSVNDNAAASRQRVLSAEAECGVFTY